MEAEAGHPAENPAVSGFFAVQDRAFRYTRLSDGSKKD